MSFASFFSEQAREPNGLFGRLVMSPFFDIGNASLIRLANEIISIQENDRVLEIGFGTGKLISKMANRIERGEIDGVDLSEIMVSVAEKRNRTHIAKGKVRLLHGDFDKTLFQTGYYDKVCSVNTIYFWENPADTAKKIAEILKPKGKIVLGFEGGEQLIQKKLKDDVYHIYSPKEIVSLLLSAGFSNGIDIQSRQFGQTELYCVVATK